MAVFKNKESAQGTIENLLKNAVYISKSSVRPFDRLDAPTGTFEIFQPYDASQQFNRMVDAEYYRKLCKGNAGRETDVFQITHSDAPATLELSVSEKDIDRVLSGIEQGGGRGIQIY